MIAWVKMLQTRGRALVLKFWWISLIDLFSRTLSYQDFTFFQGERSSLYISAFVASWKMRISAMVKLFPLTKGAFERCLSKKSNVLHIPLSASFISLPLTGVLEKAEVRSNLSFFKTLGLKVPWYQDRYSLTFAFSSRVTPLYCWSSLGKASQR